MKCDDDSGSSGCGGLMLDRIRYFTGRHMTARDFSDADAYHRSMRLLHNRVLHGWGVARGLEVAPHQRPECGLVVRCGLAIDCCGREIVVPAAVAQRIPWDRLPDGEDMVLVLCLEYCELRTEKVPVLYSNEACSSAAYEDGRVRESYALHWHPVKEADLEQYGWQLSTGCPPATRATSIPAATPTPTAAWIRTARVAPAWRWPWCAAAQPSRTSTPADAASSVTHRST